jgi:4-amino-4-deoxy-L-arabinose transferase-like glycosyltransferase
MGLPENSTASADSEPAWWLTWLNRKIKDERTAVLVVLIAGLLLFIPFLGTLGVWDPWETHYGEVARSMLVRDDYVYPYWESAYFFSKPALPLWFIAFGLWITGSENPDLPDAALGAGAEWGMRVPFALIAILCLWAVYRIGTQLKDRVTGLLCALVLASSAQFIFIGKQAMADMPFVGFLTAGLALFVAAVFDREEDAPAKPGLKIITVLGIAVSLFPQLILIGREVRGGADYAGLAAAGVVGLGYIAWLGFKGTRQQCWMAGFYVFVALSCLAKGLGPFAILAVPGALYMLLTLDFRILVRARLWMIPLFLVVGAPWYVTMSLFTGRDEEGKTFVDRFWIHDNFARVGQGVHGDRGGLGYFIEQVAYGMFPWVAMLPQALGFAAKESGRHEDLNRRRALLFILLWGIGTYAFFSMSLTKFHHYIFPAVPAFAVLIGYWISHLAESPNKRISPFTALLIATVFAVAARDLINDPQNLVNLFTYKYDRDYPRDVQPRPWIITMVAVGMGFAFIYYCRDTIHRALSWLKLSFLLDAITKQRSVANALLAFMLMGAAFGTWISHQHFNMLSPHWGQAHLFKTFHEERQPNEPIYAYQLNWRGETFYSRNRILQVKESGANERMRSLVDKPGREFIITEQSRYHTLQGVLSPDKRDKMRILDRSNNKFYLVVVDE